MSDEAKSHVFVASTEMPAGSKVVAGPNFVEVVESAKGVPRREVVDKLLGEACAKAFVSGYQASNFGKAFDEINAMLRWKSEETTAEEDEEQIKSMIEGIANPETAREELVRIRKERALQTRTKIFLGYTSNLVTSGLRDVFRFLVQHSLIQVIVTPGGGIDDDLVQCFCQPVRSHPSHKPSDYRRSGEVDIPKEGFAKLEAWLTERLREMVEIRQEWTPSAMIDYCGSKINNEASIYYWTAKNNIPVYCPSITDGFIGTVVYKYNASVPADKKIRIDLVKDIVGMNQQATQAKHTGMIILGGGLVKHHIFNANLMRNGGDHCVLINTGQEFDGSDGGARPDEGKSWGKIRITTNPVKIYSDASIVFPFVVQNTFVPYLKEQSQ